MKKRHLLLIGIASVLLFSVALAPASLLRQLVPQDVSLGRLSGSLWNGTASHVAIDQYRLQQVDWEFLPSRLLLGRLAIQLEASYQQRPQTTIAAASITQKLYLSDTRLSIAASQVAELAALPIGELEGDIDIDLEQLELAQDAVPLATGTVVWRQATVTVAETARLGEVNIEIGGADAGRLIARLSNQGGDIMLKGNGDINDTGDYTLAVDMTAGNTASNNVKNSLKMIARQQADGSYRVENKGNIFKLNL